MWNQCVNQYFCPNMPSWCIMQPLCYHYKTLEELKQTPTAPSSKSPFQSPETVARKPGHHKTTEWKSKV